MIDADMTYLRQLSGSIVAEVDCASIPVFRTGTYPVLFPSPERK